ncbi:outer membrane beta-barrel protein [Sphingomonas crusticola]|uniref:outer membrane beta-barrel protein n=1 Tax=Sphingomonas crusticola TaxID=1697973 RepID=UPI000E220B63|nr:outer membrane beta-barrel protein [Sphingomonas crusticola]
MRFATYLAASTAFILASSAVAQTTDTAPVVNNTVVTQTALPTRTASQVLQDDDAARRALEPVGARFGSFTLFPKLETQLMYNDNIYALQNKTDDFIARISPQADLRGDFGTVTTALRAAVDRYQYFDNTSENRTDWSLGGNAQAEARRGLFIYGAGGYSKAHEDRGDPNASYTDRDPTKYNLTEAGAGISSDITRLSYGLDASYRKYNFADNRQISGAIVNNDDRDRSVSRIAGRVGLELSPGYRVLARGSYQKIGYDLNFDDAGYNRDSKEVRGTLGVQFELTRLLQGEVFAGYLNRTYKDPRFSDISAPVFGTSLTWLPTPLATVRLNIDRTVQETVVAGFRGFVSTSGSLSIDYEVLRTLILTADVRYGHDDYRGSRLVPTTRNDDNYGASVGGRYLFNRNLYGGITYDWSKKSSSFTGPGLEYNRNRITATLGLQL